MLDVLLRSIAERTCLRDISIAELDMRKASLVGLQAEFLAANKAILSGVDLRRAFLSDADFLGGDLSEANFSDATVLPLDAWLFCGVGATCFVPPPDSSL